MTPGAREFEILYSKWLLPLFLFLGLGQAFTRVELDERELTVRMGWAFCAKIPRTSIVKAERSRDWPWAIGVHTNMRGAWLVNGSSRGIVFLEIDPPADARSLARHPRAREAVGARPGRPGGVPRCRGPAALLVCWSG